MTGKVLLNLRSRKPITTVTPKADSIATLSI